MGLIWLVFALGCGEKDSDSGGDPAACVLYQETGCDECVDGEVTCHYEDYSATAVSCGGCQAQVALYETLCDAGVRDDRATILAGVVCVDVR